MARSLAPAVKLGPEAKRLRSIEIHLTNERTMEDQLEMIVSKQLKMEDRDLISVRECRYLLTRLFQKESPALCGDLSQGCRSPPRRPSAHPAGSY